MRVTVVDVPDAGRIRNWILAGLGVLVLLYVAWVVREIWLPLGLAMLIAVILDPVVDRMEMRGWKRQSAAAFIFAGFILVTVGLIYLAVPRITGEFAEMSRQIQKQFPIRTAEGIAQTLSDRYSVEKPVAELIAKGVLQAGDALSRSTGSLTKFGLGFASNLIWVVIIPIVAFYALRDFHLILGKLLLLVPQRKRKLAQTTVAEISAIFARYLRGLGIVSVLNGVATWLVLMACRVEAALLIGVVAGLLYAVPYIGAFLTLAITAAFSFLQGQGDTTLLVKAMVASVILHQIVFDQIISPRILGGQVGIHPIISIVALLSGNLLLGIIGMILAVPLAAVVQIGVLALVPKLRVDLDVDSHPVTSEAPSAAAQAAQLAEDAKDIQIRREDATGELHASVLEAVEEIEAEVQRADKG